MNNIQKYKQVIDESHAATDALFERIEKEAKERYPGDDNLQHICRLSYEYGTLRGMIRNLAVEVALDKYVESQKP